MSRKQHFCRLCVRRTKARQLYPTADGKARVAVCQTHYDQLMAERQHWVKVFADLAKQTAANPTPAAAHSTESYPSKSASNGNQEGVRHATR